MKKHLSITFSALLLSFLLICHNVSEAQNGQGKLFIIGGGSRPVSMVQQMIEESGMASDGGYGVVLPMASSVPDTSAYYGMLQFREQGIQNVTAFNFADSTLNNVSGKLDSLRHASLIYVPGGVQSRFMAAVEQSPGLEKAIRAAYQNGALIAGTSAGAAIMSQIMITGDQKKYPEYTPTFYHLEKDNLITEEGLGLIRGVIIDQHFVKRGRNNRLLTAVMEYPNKTGIGIDESTAIVVSGDRVKVVGESQVLVYRNRSDSVRVENGKFGAHNITLQIYLPGDPFRLKDANSQAIKTNR